jgi:peptidoglycan hydrolase CwlO-like protein
MDNDQLNELATNALLDHWPPYMGVRTEAEKVEYLVNALSEVEVKSEQIEALENQIEALGKEAVDLENKLAARDITVKQLEDEIGRLNGKIVDLQERCTELGECQ